MNEDEKNRCIINKITNPFIFHRCDVLSEFGSGSLLLFEDNAFAIQLLETETFNRALMLGDVVKFATDNNLKIKSLLWE